MKDDPNVHTLTKDEIHKVAKERIEEITREFKEGFSFLEEYPKSVTFFGSTQFKENNKYYQSARELAGRIANELGYAVVTGGGPGIMEAANRGAKESCDSVSDLGHAINVCGASLGLTIEIPDGQVVNKYIGKEVDSYYFFVRKVLLSFSAEAFIFYPGGFGTLDEFYEIITLIQTKKIKGVPLICVGSDYWKSLERFMQSEMLSRGAILPEDLLLYHITDDHDEILNIIRKAPVRNSLEFKLNVEVPPEPTPIL